MTKYNHNKPPKYRLDRRDNFVKYCVTNIKIFPAGNNFAVSYTGDKFKNFHFVKSCSSLSYSWSVCSRIMWSGNV